VPARRSPSHYKIFSLSQSLALQAFHLPSSWVHRSLLEEVTMSHSSIEKHDADKHIQEKHHGVCILFATSRDAEQHPLTLYSVLQADHLEHVKGSNLRDAETKQVHNAALAAAAAAGKLNPWSRESFLLYLCCFVAFLCSCANGYDGSLMLVLSNCPFGAH
jgi:hypothetical protein